MLDGPRLAPLSGAKPNALVILVHGYGSNGDDLISLAAMMQPERYCQSNGAVIFLSGYARRSGSARHVLFSEIPLNVLGTPLPPRPRF